MSSAHAYKKRKKNLTHLGLKIGQGGTLDPLADGVLGMSSLLAPTLSRTDESVMGVNRGTKHLARFIECTKVRLLHLGSRMAFDAV